jgi:exonuclease SbcC
MIPQRVRLRGFLCYKDEQLIEFDGNATLWMLSGLNGSGKSAIFDAVTYALFGYHRGGSMHAHELINKDADTLLVEFDFLLDRHLYRAKRTLKRDTKGGARGTQQMSRFEDGSWVPVPDTGQKREFDAWVEENVGLRYETFTSSVLLLQGKAERLLDSKPEGRREVLASIVDLGRYERLHQKADERRKAQEGALKALQSRLAALPAVAPLELQEAKNHIGEAEEARAQARAEVERLLSMEAHAKQWQDLQARLAQARQRWEKAKGVLADASAIEQAVERLRELREVLPHLKEIAGFRGQAKEAEEQLRFQEREREKQAAALAQKDSTLKQARDRRITLHGQIARDESSHRDVSTRLRKLSAQLTMLQECERQENDLLRLREEIGRMPADPAALVAMAREAYERLDAVDRQVPVLTRFAGRRNELARAIKQEKACEEMLQTVRARGEAKKSEAEALRPRALEAQATLQAASDMATEARTILTQARQSLDELHQLDGSKVCRHCGQALTPGHIDEEKKRRSRAVQQADTKAKQGNAELEAARREEADLREQLERVDKAYQEAREEYRDHNRQLTGARAAVEKAQEECGHIWHELPEAYRLKISAKPAADWLTTAYPKEADLEALRVQVRELAPARAKLREAEKVQQKWSGLKAQESQALESLNRLFRDLPKDRQALRRQHADLEAEEKALFKSMDAHRHQVGEVEREIERLTRERDAAQAELSRTDTRLKEQQLVRQNAERGIQVHLKALPAAAWQAQAEAVGLREMHTLTGELAHLEEQGTDERSRELEHARHNVAVLEQDVRQLEKQEAAAPPEARQDPTSIAARLKEARRVDGDRDESLAQARQRLALLESYQRQRQQLDREHRELEAGLQSDRLLSELLGKDRLQLYLVRQAERQVVEYANAVLDRLSGGQLYLKLSGEANGEGASAKALDLEAYNRATGERPINVAFLSGSQKFRVAVSLALGIGQYASRQHRPIESVIIDEGFGCLDSQGRQVMIQELQNLRSQMRCILLVSHQEDFAESFSDGYHFHLENGATRVRRFQK